MNTELDDRLLSTKKAAEFLGMKPATLDAWRCRKMGPDWVVVGKRSIRYRLTVLTNYLRSGECHNDSSETNTS